MIWSHNDGKSLSHFSVFSASLIFLVLFGHNVRNQRVSLFLCFLGEGGGGVRLGYVRLVPPPT